MFNVLIIDDEIWSRQVVRSLGAWESLRLNVIGEADGGREGLELIEKLAPHIVVTDMRMPGLDGVELLKHFNDRFPMLKIIVMSGYDDFIYLKQAIRSRAVEYLLKPIDPEELNAALARCIKELEQEERTAQAARGSLHMFADKAELDAYLILRQQVYEHLLELNRPAVLHALAKLEEYANRSSSASDTHDAGLPARIGHDFMLMLEEFMAGGEPGPDRAWAALIRDKASAISWTSIAEVIDGLADFFGETIEAVEAHRRNRNRLDVAEVRAYIDRHFPEPISLESLAQHFFVSKEHLSRVFKASLGENLSDYVIKKRMEKAKELIVEHTLAIKQIAELTGYSDQAYFYKVFKNYYGVTPGELRKEQ